MRLSEPRKLNLCLGVKLIVDFDILLLFHASMSLRTQSAQDEEEVKFSSGAIAGSQFIITYAEKAMRWQQLTSNSNLVSLWVGNLE